MRGNKAVLTLLDSLTIFLRQVVFAEFGASGTDRSMYEYEGRSTLASLQFFVNGQLVFPLDGSMLQVWRVLVCVFTLGNPISSERMVANMNILLFLPLTLRALLSPHSPDPSPSGRSHFPHCIVPLQGHEPALPL